MQAFFTELAERDLESIGDYIAADNPKRALSFIREIRTHCEKVARSPLHHPARPELGAGIQTCSHQRYLIISKVEKERVLIVRVLHGARDIESLLADDD